MRGQTTLDFAIGISVFLAVLIFVFLFVPGLLSPFTTGAEEETVTANRVADHLTKSMLGSPSEPYRLNRACTVRLFDDGDDVPPCSGSWAAGDSIEEQVGLDSADENLNVTIRGNVSTAGDGSEILCWDGTDDTVVEAPESACDPAGDPDDVLFTRGDKPPSDNDESVTAIRVATLSRQDVTVYVEMW